MPASDIDAFLKTQDIDEIKKVCEALFLAMIVDKQK